MFELFVWLKKVRFCDIIWSRKEAFSMRKNFVDIAIIVLLIIIIILLVILVWPEEKKSSVKKSKKVEEVEILEKDSITKNPVGSDETSSTDTSKGLFTDTKKASTEAEVISYIEGVDQEVLALSKTDVSDKHIKEQLEDTFITLTDFIFYGGVIKGVTFQELTDSAKSKVLSLYESIDSKIESSFPNYKENIKSTAQKSYHTALTKAKELKNSILASYKEKVLEEQYNNVVNNYEEDKNNFQEAYSPYVEKGKEAIDKAYVKGKEVFDQTKDKLSSWYQNFKESRE